jgi:hypothetical protein
MKFMGGCDRLSIQVMFVDSSQPGWSSLALCKNYEVLAQLLKQFMYGEWYVNQISISDLIR